MYVFFVFFIIIFSILPRTSCHDNDTVSRATTIISNFPSKTMTKGNLNAAHIEMLFVVYFMETL